MLWVRKSQDKCFLKKCFLIKNLIKLSNEIKKLKINKE